MIHFHPPALHSLPTEAMLLSTPAAGVLVKYIGPYGIHRVGRFLIVHFIYSHNACSSGSHPKQNVLHPPGPSAMSIHTRKACQGISTVCFPSDR